MKQEEILLISKESFCARVGSAIGFFRYARNSKKQKFRQKLKLPRIAQDEPRRPGEHPRVPRRQFPAQKQPRGRNPEKNKNDPIRAVSWHLRGFQKPTGPPLSGRLGLSRCPRELSHMVRSTLPPLRLSGGPQVDRTQPVTIHSKFIKFQQFLSSPGPKEIVAGLGEARGNSFDTQGKFLRQSWVGNRIF